MSEELIARIADVETKLGTLIGYQDFLTKHIDGTLNRLTLIAEEQLDSLLPIGSIVMYSLANDFPEKFLDCDGLMVEIKEYPKLYAAIGRSFTDIHVGQDYFCVPDMRFRTPVCAGEHNAGDDYQASRLDAIDRAQWWLTPRRVGEIFGTEFMVHQWLEYTSRKKKDDFDVYISRGGSGEGADAKAITIPTKRWQPSIALRFMIRAF